MIFFENLPVYYINLDRRVDRLEYFTSHANELNLKNLFRIKAIDGKNIKEKVDGMSDVEIACSMSHLLALKDFLKSDFEFAMICEDDVDLSNSRKINFNFYDIFKNNSAEEQCLQTSISLRKEDSLPFKMVSRSYWYFCTASYIVNRKYAENLVNNYFTNNEINLNNFKRKSIVDPRGGFMEIKPVADQLVYSLPGTRSLSLFSLADCDADIGVTDENKEQVSKCIEDFNNYWSSFQVISTKDIV